MKKLLLVLAITLCVSVLFADPIENLNKWAEEQTSEFSTDDVVSFLNGNRTDGDITYGSEYEFNSSDTRECSATSLDATHFVITYQDRGNYYYGTAIVGTVSGNTITYGSEYIFNSTSTSYISATTLDATHFAVAYEDDYSGDGLAIVGTVSGSTITYGTENEFVNDTWVLSTATLDANHFVIAYVDGGSYYGTAIVGTVSGSTITYGTEYVFKSSITYHPSVTSLDATHFVVAYQDYSNSEYGAAIVGTVSGSTITYGSEYVFSSVDTSWISATALDANHFVVAYMASPFPFDLIAIVGAVSGSVISYGSEFTFSHIYSDATSAIRLDASHFVVTYLDLDPSYCGNSIVGEVEGTSPPVTPENVEIEIIGSDVVITWDAVVGDPSYIVYSSDEPYDNFSEDLSGLFVDESWSTPIINEKKFYYVTATN